METGYTPAPWIVELSPISGPARVIAPDGCGTGCPCEIVGEAMPEDARLIAAAPDLVEALAELLRIADEYSDSMRKIGRGHSELGSDSPSHSASGMARAALAKAGVL